MARRRIGVVGGVGPASTVLYYQLLIAGTQARSSGRELPEVLVDSLDLNEIEEFMARGDMQGLEDRVVRSVAGLGDGGCDSVVIACNSMHLVYDRVASRVAVPMVNLIEAVINATLHGGYRSVGLLAATFVVRGGLYGNPLEARGVRCLVPPEPEQIWLMETILGDLQKPVVPAQTIERLIQNVRDLQARGAEAVILGCTDLPVAINAANSPLPVLDTARIHVDAVLDRVVTPA